jgi:hypothetical protein
VLAVYTSCDGKCVGFRSVRGGYHEVIPNSAEISETHSRSHVPGDFSSLNVCSKHLIM